MASVKVEPELKASPAARDELREIRSNSFEHRGWQFSYTEGPIGTSLEEEAAQKEIGLPQGVPLPEQLFVHNSVRVKHVASGHSFTFSPVGALRQWHSRQVQTLQTDDNPVSATNCDPSFVSEYSGELACSSMAGSSSAAESGDAGTTYSWPSLASDVSIRLNRSPEASLPMDRLRRQGDILFACEVVLFDDDLHDMGISKAVVKLRVMKDCFLLLYRHFYYNALDATDKLRLRDVRLAACLDEAPSKCSCELVADIQLRTGAAIEVARKTPGLGAGAAPWASASARPVPGGASAAATGGSRAGAPAAAVAGSAVSRPATSGADSGAGVAESALRRVAPAPDSISAPGSDAARALRVTEQEVFAALEPTEHIVAALPLKS